ncbi:MAG TPA: hypothetical protein VFO95_00315 [Gemmatimonadales bacterium]|nr:hypothetical protein [Gemmatimonadales bacterium]
MRGFSLTCAIVLAACGGGTGSSGSAVEPDRGPPETVDQFMRAVADSNLTRMAELWGSTSGSAAATGRPDDYQRRVAIMHAYLAHSKGRVVNETERTADRAVLMVEITRENCQKQVPFTLVRTSSGTWVIERIELGMLGSPGRPCTPG